ncbi:hypothetical protein KQX54_001092 [Cotesia glomerata]|uniref:Uncharacterized protein n=1 Tax=Cotesia glomerata TaxID=32391 RepID=A0AAV7IYZ8_COTGL|nr:hypothetical protein KQX54_001092 [Cotesia glomerata]
MTNKKYLLSNIFIGVLLLLKQQNITSSEQETEIGILRDYNNDASDNHTNLDDSNECDFTSLLMNYAIVIVPFVNNFVSVLSKSLCCNYNVGCVKNKLKELLSSKKMSSYSTSIEELGSQFRFFKSRSNNIFTIVSIVGQWMVPIVSLMLLYLTGYENINSYVRSYELKCLDMMNFPFDDCYSNISKPEQEQFDGLDTIDALDDISVMNTTDFIFQDDDDDDDNNTLNAVESTATNSSETNKIIFKIQEIVQSALNNSQDIPEWYFSNSISNSSKLELKKTRKINNIEENLLDNEITIKCMKNNKCLIPPNVLKTHMILLIFIIYFGSILLSTVYCIKSNYTCFNIKQHLLAVESMDKVTGDKQESVEDEKDNKNQQPTSSDAIQWTNSCIDVQSAENIKEETCDVEKIIFICKTSVLLAVLLWTPIFIQLIGKIFMCMESYWSMNFFYLAAMSYGVIRNFLNNDMVKTKKIVPQI